MAARTTPRPATKTGAAPLPHGTRVPYPDAWLYLVRGLVLGSLLLHYAHLLLLPWALAYQPPSHAAPTAPTAAPTRTTEVAGSDDDALTPFIAQAVLLLPPPLARLFGGLGTLGVVIMAVEAGLSIDAQRRQRRVYPHMPTTYLLVRGLRPQVSAAGRMAGSTTPSGDQFYRAIQLAIPAASGVWGWRERQRGSAPWVAFTLTGTPDTPIAMGVLVADHMEARRADTVMQLRAIIQGQCPGAQVDAAPDPLLSALTPGVRVVWHEYGLRLAPHYPLRFLDDIEGSDLLGPLVNGLLPAGVIRTEFQLILRPANRWALNRGWRGHATALLLQLQAKADYALPDDTATLEAKLAAAPFEAALRLCVVAAHDPSAQAHSTATLNQLGGLLGQYHQRTSHHLQTLVRCGDGHASIQPDQPPLLIHTRAPRIARIPPFLLPALLWRMPDLLTSIELAGFWHPPTSGLGSAVRWLTSTYIPAPAEAFTHDDPARVQLGTAQHADGTLAPVGPTWKDLCQVLHVTAGMGAGKTRLLANICVQALARGLLLLDGKGDDAGCLAARVRTYLPLAAERRLILFDILDTEWPIGLNPLAGIDFQQPGAQTQALGQIMAIFSRLDPGWAGAPGMQEYVLNASLLVFEGQAHPTLAHIKQALLDAHYRARLLIECTNPEIRTYWQVEYPQHGEKQKTSLFALMRRFARLLTDTTTRYLVSQPIPRLDLLRAIEEGQIVLAPLPHQKLGTIASAVGMLLLQAVVRAAMRRPGDDTTRTTYPLIIDELQIFISEDDGNKDMETATSQLRGFGIAGIYAHQTISQLGPLENEMLTNAGSRVVLRTQDPDASTYARMYTGTGISAADISGQDPEEHQYVDLLCQRRKTGIFSMRTMGWPQPQLVEAAPHTGPAWQTLLPPDSPNRTFDRDVCKLIYGRHQQRDLLAAGLATKSEEEWTQLLTRWAAIRDHQRAYILEHPGCIPDRMERQMWLSRLGYATPVLLAEAEYARIRREIANESENESDAAQQQSATAERAKDAGSAGSAGGAPPSRAHLRVVDPARIGNTSDVSSPDEVMEEEDDED